MTDGEMSRRLEEALVELQSTTLAAGWEFMLLERRDSEILYQARAPGGAWRRVRIYVDSRGRVTAQEMDVATEWEPAPTRRWATPPSDAAEDAISEFIAAAESQGVIGGDVAGRLRMLNAQLAAGTPARSEAPVSKGGTDVDLYPGLDSCSACGATIDIAVETCPHCGHAGESLTAPEAAPPPHAATPATVTRLPVTDQPRGFAAPAPSTSRAPRPWDTWSEQIAKLRTAVASDLALHGFSYLALLLTFIGVFGFMFFSFTDVPDSAQPIVELIIPVVFFGWAWDMRRRRAIVVARAMETLGGLLLPIVVFASLVDGAPFPPDLTGGALIVGLVLSGLAVAGGYLWWTKRHPDAALRYLIGPALWFSALALGFVFKTDESLEGIAITHLVPAQAATGAVAIALTLILVGRYPGHFASRPVTVAALPSIVGTYALAVGLTTSDGWASPIPVTVAGAALMISAETLGRRFDRRREARLSHLLLIPLVVAPLTEVWGVGWVGVAGTLAYLSWVEWETPPASRPGAATWLAIGGATAGLAMSLEAGWSMTVAWAAASAWGHRRRLVGFSGFEPVITGVAALAPVALAVGLHRALPADGAWLVVGAILGVVAVWSRVAASEDVFWAAWPSTAAIAVAAGAAIHWFGAASSGPSVEVAAAVSGLSALVVATGHRWPAGRVWLAGLVFVSTVAMLLDEYGEGPFAEPVPWALLATGGVAAAAVWRRTPAGHLAVIGHLVGIAAAAGSLSDGASWPAAIVLLAIGWVASVVSEETGGASAAGVLSRAVTLLGGAEGGRAQRLARAVPPLAMAATVPVAILAAADGWDRFAANRSWTGVAVGLTALAYGSVARLLRSRRPVAPILTTGAAVMSVIGVAVAAPVPWPVIIAVGALILVAALTAPDQPTAFTWLAWIASGVMVVLLAERAGVPPGELDVVGAGWAALLLLGGLAVDDARSGRRQPGDGVRVPGLRPAVGVGALALPLILAPSITGDGGGWWALGAAAAYVVASVQMRAAIVSAAAYGFGAFGLTVVLPWHPWDEPLALVGVAAGLAVASWVTAALARSEQPAAVWLQWDLPPLSIALVVGSVAMARAAAIDAMPATWIAAGLVSMAVGLWRRNRWWGDAGNVVALVGAAAAGHGALALALVATAGRAAIEAMRKTAAERIGYQVASVAAGGWAWLEVLVWRDWPAASVVEHSALVFGGLALVVGVAARFGWSPRDWALAWGSLGTAGSVVAAAASLQHLDAGWPVAGILLFAAGAAIGAGAADDLIGSSGRAGLVVASVAAIGWAWVELLVWRDWPAASAVGYSALAFGGLALAVGVATRWLPRDWTLAWGALATTGITASGVASLEYPGGAWPTLGSLLFAIGAALAVRPLSLRGLSYVAIYSGAFAWVQVVVGSSWSGSTIVAATSVGAGVVAVLGAITLRVERIDRSWPAALGSLSIVAPVVAWMATAGPDGAFAVDGWLPGLGLVVVAASITSTAGTIGQRAHYVGAATSGWAWVALVLGLGWAVDTGAAATGVVFGLLAVAVAELARLGRLGRGPSARPDSQQDGPVMAWASLSAIGVLIGALTAVADPTTTGWLGLGAGFGLLAWASARAALPLAMPVLRDSAALAAVISINGTLIGLSGSPTQLAAALVIAGVASTVALLIVWRRQPDSVWLSSLISLTALAGIEAAAIAAGQWPDRSMLTAALLALGVEAMAAGLAMGRPSLASVGPPVLFGAWLAAAGDSLGGSPQWYTVPIAVVVLAEVELSRWARRLDSQAPGTVELLAAEWVGIGLLTVTPLAQMFTDGALYGAFAFAAAVALLVWALLTRVRRRVVSALVLGTVTAVLWVTVATAASAPPSAFSWITIAGIGLAALVGIAIVESYRSKTGRVMRRIDQLTEGWE